MSSDLLYTLKQRAYRLNQYSELVDVSDELYRVRRAIRFLRGRLAN